jgi:hypothetical protein
LQFYSPAEHSPANLSFAFLPSHLPCPSSFWLRPAALRFFAFSRPFNCVQSCALLCKCRCRPNFQVLDLPASVLAQSVLGDVVPKRLIARPDCQETVLMPRRPRESNRGVPRYYHRNAASEPWHSPFPSPSVPSAKSVVLLPLSTDFTAGKDKKLFPVPLLRILRVLRLLESPQSI